MRSAARPRRPGVGVLHPAQAQRFLLRMLLRDVRAEPVSLLSRARRAHHAVQIVCAECRRLHEQNAHQARIQIARVPQGQPQRVAIL
jgi:hypothetical protein